MNKLAAKISYVFVVIVMAMINLSGVSKADVNDFTIHSFDATYNLTRDDKQGKLTTTEKIDLTFTDNNHGILRAIPAKFGSQKTHPNVLSVKRDGANEPFTTYDQNDNLVLKIGNATSTITGKHNYEIKYSVVNVIRFFEDHDELFWDVNGDQWTQPFESVTGHFVPPADSPFAANPTPICYAGVNGSKGRDCKFVPPTSATSNDITVTTTRKLIDAETLTAVLAIPKGYFTPVPLWEKLLPFAPLAVFLSLLLLIINNATAKWRKFGKDYKAPPVVAPAFGPPRGFTPILAGYLYEDSLNPKHITATIIDLAIRGYIKIIEKDKDKLIGKKTLRYLELQKSYADLTEPEVEAMKKLFPEGTIGESVDIDTQKNKLYSLLDPLGKKLATEAEKKGLYELSPEKSKSALSGQLVAVIVLLVLSFFLTGILTPFAIPLAFISLFIVIGLQASMTRRSKQGVADKSELEGLKLYLSTAEKDRLSALQSADAPLAANAKEPIRTVELFEKLLPYAVLFGVEKTWAAAFKDLYTSPPEWYQGNWAAFNTGVFVSSLNSSVGSFNSSFTAPSSSGGSGFSGGGGSGGGGGGGGGGGW